MSQERIKQIEAEIAELKARWPKHGVKLSMWRQLEDMEGALEAARLACVKDNAG